ncbi:hypothetical protein E2C01_002313 [Portunus trituberculatus]|uniref:Uncharacterized protein n=1 Tax=Portunus trituberculatus TaxID=210409 RepID=A0A5B7CMY8_PORTR|nr:hypothetical protein [Portunus trituberculatus]
MAPQRVEGWLVTLQPLSPATKTVAAQDAQIFTYLAYSPKDGMGQGAASWKSTWQEGSAGMGPNGGCSAAVIPLGNLLEIVSERSIDR